MNQVQQQTIEGIIEALDIAGKIMKRHTNEIRSLQRRISILELEKLR